MEKKGNVGIITYIYNANYGGVLQLYALMTYLKNEGYNVKYINRMYPEKNKLFKFIRDTAKFVIQKNRKRDKRNRNINMFFQQYIQPQTEKIWTRSDFKKLNKEKFSTIIAGSDQIWRPWSFVEDYFLGFTDLLNYVPRKIAYSASFGVDEWLFDPQTTLKVKQLASKFDAISVRESSGTELCKKYLDRDALLTLDPTMLLSPEQYISLFEQRSNYKPYIATYILDMNETKSQICEYIGNHFSLELYHIQKTNEIRESVQSWLRSIYEADFIVTDSFHGTVFSIIFNKPFISIGNTQRGMARFSSILSLFSLERRLLVSNSLKDIDNIINNTIDWKQVNEKIKIMQGISKGFLKNNVI